MGGLKMIISRFIANFKKTEFWTNHRLQAGILIAATIITIIVKLFPVINNSVSAILCGIIMLGGPATVLAIYDGIWEDSSDDDDRV